MAKNYLILVGVLGVLAVSLGAFGAHTLSALVTKKSLSAFQTGVQYHFYHTFTIFGTALLISKSNHPNLMKKAILAFIVGIILFSGSLYLLACSKILGINHLNKIIGPITPIGGVAFIIGWSLLIYAGFTETKLKDE